MLGRPHGRDEIHLGAETLADTGLDIPSGRTESRSTFGIDGTKQLCIRHAFAVDFIPNAGSTGIPNFSTAGAMLDSRRKHGLLQSLGPLYPLAQPIAGKTIHRWGIMALDEKLPLTLFHQRGIGCDFLLILLDRRSLPAACIHRTGCRDPLRDGLLFAALLPHPTKIGLHGPFSALGRGR